MSKWLSGLGAISFVLASLAAAQIPVSPGVPPQMQQGQGSQSIFDPSFGRALPSPVPPTFTVPGMGSGPAAPIINNRGRQGMPAGALDRPGMRGSGQLQQEELPQQVPSVESRERLPFQDFLLQATGRDLPLFGSNLFRASPSTFAPVEDAPVTPDYVIGPGDEILIRAWGQIDVDFSAEVDRTGAIAIPKVGVLNVAGLRYSDLPVFIRKSFERQFRNFELTVSLGALRSIQIFVVGNAKRPGTYKVSSLSTLVTALFAVGGPSARGSMRKIQLKRGNAVATEFDLYELLLSGNKSKDVSLASGDIIYIPPVGSLVAVTGSVNNQAIYELNGQSSLSDVIGWAGGLSTTAQGQSVTVERIDQRRSRSVEQLTLDSAGLAKPIRDGDVVAVHSLTARFDNAITLRGNVAQPGRHAWHQGMRVRDLIPTRDALMSRDFWIARSQLVGMDENVSRILQQQDSTGTKLGVSDLAERPLRDDPNITVGEAIRLRQIERDATRLVTEIQPGPAGGPNGLAPSAPRTERKPGDQGTERTRLMSQFTPSLKEINWEYAVVERLSSVDLTASIIPFNLGKAVLEGDSQHNLALQPGDVVTIFSREDIQVPQAKQTKFVRLEGEFAAPGVYQVQPGETLRQLVVRVGGVSGSAYLFGATLTRESTRIQQQRNLDDAINRLEQDMFRASSSRAQNVTTAEDASTLKQQQDAQQLLLSRLRQIRPTGRIVLELPEKAGVAGLPDLVLEDADRFVVPSTPSMVNVFGSVFNENSFIYRPDKRVTDYLAQAGGPTRFADRGSVYVLRADGSVVSKQQSSFFLSSFDGQRLMPGDSIVVPEELDRTSTMRMLKDISQLFYQFGLGAAALKVLRD
jgi:polysaccharide biosynthesis/export protein